MAKITLYLSDDLKRRMDATEVERGTWSTLASRAFEAKLAEVLTREEPKDMQEVIARMRAIKGGPPPKDPSVLPIEGLRDGRRWATGKATPAELERLEAAYNDHPARLYDAEWRDPLTTWNEPYYRFYAVINPCSDRNLRVLASSFWQSVATDPRSNPYHESEYLEGFAHGAMEVWQEVKDKL